MASRGMGSSLLYIQCAASDLPPATLHAQSCSPFWRWCHRWRQHMQMDVTIFAAQWRMMRWHCAAMDNASAAAHINNPNCETRWCGGSTPAEQSGQGEKVTWPWWYGASLGGSKTHKRDILRVFSILARSRHINFPPLSSHDIVVVLISYVH